MANIKNIKIGNTDPSSVMFDTVTTRVSDYQFDFTNWTKNTENDITVQNNKVIIRKFKPNVWILKSPNYSSITELCSASKNMSISISGMAANSALFNRSYVHHSVVGGSGNTYGTVRGVGIFPYSDSIPGWQLSTYGTYAQNRGELPYSSYVWDNLTLTNGSTVKIGSESTFRGNWGAGYNGYGKTGDHANITVIPDYSTFATPYTTLRLSFGLYTGNAISFDAWQCENKVNSLKMTISTRNENGTNGTKAAYCYSNFGTISIRVSGLASGDTLTYGTTGTSSATITSNGEYSITYSEGYGFTLYGDTSNTDTVTIELINNQYLSLDGLVDVSDNPIIISIPNIVGKNLTNIECWDMYIGDTNIYHKDKTIDNCWIKYGIATKDDQYITVEYTGADKITLPQVVDLQDNLGKIIWNKINTSDTSTYDQAKEAYANMTISSDLVNAGAFRDSSIPGSLIINVNNISNDVFLDAFSGSEFESITLNVKEVITSGQNLFRNATKLKTIICAGGIGSNDCSGMFEYCNSLESYQENLIAFDTTGNRQTSTIGGTNVAYCWEYTFNLKTIPGSNYTITMLPYSPQVFNGSGVTTIEPILDMTAVQPDTGAYKLFQCDKLVSAKIKNLNHGNWYLDGTKDHGNLPNLDQTSIEYLFSNLYGLPSGSLKYVEKSPSSCFQEWDYSLNNNRTRLVEIEVSERNVVLNSTSKALTNASYTVTGLVDGDKITFNGSEVSITNNTFTISNTEGNHAELKLINETDPSNTSIVIVKPTMRYSSTYPKVSSAELHCPSTWNSYITSSMITSANLKGWNIYVGGSIRTS